MNTGTFKVKKRYGINYKYNLVDNVKSLKQYKKTKEEAISEFELQNIKPKVTNVFDNPSGILTDSQNYFAGTGNFNLHINSTGETGMGFAYGRRTNFYY